MNKKDLREDIHKCSKCGLCQAVCPVYKVTGNDCTVSRGQFAMLEGVFKGKLKISGTINKYLNLCLKCGACSKFCPSGINVIDIIVKAKYEYYKHHPIEKIKSLFKKIVVFGLIPNLFNLFQYKKKSKSFQEKAIFFGGCGSKIKGDKGVVKILNNLGVEVINPNFSCCGISFFTSGDIETFQNYISDYIKTLKKYNIEQVVTTCASCEKSLKDYIKWAKTESERDFLKTIKVKNIYEYLAESNLELKLKNHVNVTYHKPCNITNFQDVEKILKNTKNLEYTKMEDYDSCCGLNGIFNPKEYKILSKIFDKKRKNIINTNSKIVLTSCLGCEVALKYYSKGKYKVYDLIDFISNRL